MKSIPETYTLSGIKVLQATNRNVCEIVEIHLKSFPDFFLTFLGRDFLRILYQEIMTEPGHVAFVAVDDGTIVGFVVGVIHQSGFYKRLIGRRLFVFAPAAFRAALRRPSIIPRLFRALSFPSYSQNAVSQALLMSIAVVPDFAGSGIGQELVRKFLGEMRRNAISSVSLATDRDDNARTNRFYMKLGFHLARKYVTHEGRAMNEYVIQL